MSVVQGVGGEEQAAELPLLGRGEVFGGEESAAAEGGVVLGVELVLVWGGGGGERRAKRSEPS